MPVKIKKQEPICLRKSAPATQKVHHILSAICPLKVLKSTKKNTKLQNCRPLQMALLCGFSDYIESCRKPNSTFNSRTGHHTAILPNGLQSRSGDLFFYKKRSCSLLVLYSRIRNFEPFFRSCFPDYLPCQN